MAEGYEINVGFDTRSLERAKKDLEKLNFQSKGGGISGTGESNYEKKQNESSKKKSGMFRNLLKLVSSMSFILKIIGFVAVLLNLGIGMLIGWAIKMYLKYKEGIAEFMKGLFLLPFKIANSIVGFFEKLVNATVWVGNKIIDLINFFKSEDIKPIANVDFGRFQIDLLSAGFDLNKRLIEEEKTLQGKLETQASFMMSLENFYMTEQKRLDTADALSLKTNDRHAAYLMAAGGWYNQAQTFVLEYVRQGDSIGDALKKVADNINIGADNLEKGWREIAASMATASASAATTAAAATAAATETAAATILTTAAATETAAATILTTAAAAETISSINAQLRLLETQKRAALALPGLQYATGASNSEIRKSKEKREELSRINQERKRLEALKKDLEKGNNFESGSGVSQEYLNSIVKDENPTSTTTNFNTQQQQPYGTIQQTQSQQPSQKEDTLIEKMSDLFSSISNSFQSVKNYWFE